MVDHVAHITWPINGGQSMESGMELQKIEAGRLWTDKPSVRRQRPVDAGTRSHEVGARSQESGVRSRGLAKTSPATSYSP